MKTLPRTARQTSKSNATSDKHEVSFGQIAKFVSQKFKLFALNYDCFIANCESWRQNSQSNEAIKTFV